MKNCNCFQKSISIWTPLLYLHVNISTKTSVQRRIHVVCLHGKNLGQMIKEDLLNLFLPCRSSNYFHFFLVSKLFLVKIRFYKLFSSKIPEQTH